MSKDDSLLRAAKALRNANYTAPARSKSTRARILMSLNATRERRRRRWFAGIPLGVLVLGGSAWAQSTGHLAQWLQTLEEVSVRFVEAPSLNPLARSNKRTALASTGASVSEAGVDPVALALHHELEPVSSAAKPEAPPLPLIALSDGSGSAVIPTPQNAQLDSLPESRDATQGSQPLAATKVGRPNSADRRPKNLEVSATSARSIVNAHGASNIGNSVLRTDSGPRSSSSGAASSNTARLEPEPARSVATSQRAVAENDAELALFRVAHDLHFKQAAPQASIAAHRAYLASYPRGRFVPEALYNIAVDQLRSGDKVAAQRQLEIFAAGKYGGYRQREAQQLLRAVEGPAL